MSIVVHDQSIAAEFLSGDVVFKISATTAEGTSRDVHMVVNRYDYEKLLSAHQYTPLLFMLSLPQRLSYLYECLNRKFKRARDEHFVFWWRSLGKNEWAKWFTVSPYIEDHALGPVPNS